MKIAAIAIALALAGPALDVHAQNAGGAQAPGNSSGGGFGRGGQHQQQSPEKIAEELMQKFDADSDGELSQDELTHALDALDQRHPRAGGGRSRHHGGRPGGGAPTGQPASIPHGEIASQGGSTASDASAGADGAQNDNQARPSTEQIAARMIDKYSSDKKGLKAAELAKAIEERRAKARQQTGASTASPNAS